MISGFCSGLNKVFFGASYIAASAASGAYVIETAMGFWNGEDADDADSWRLSTWLTFGAAGLAAVPMTAAMINSWMSHEAKHSEHEEKRLQNPVLEDEVEPSATAEEDPLAVTSIDGALTGEIIAANTLEVSSSNVQVFLAPSQQQAGHSHHHDEGTCHEIGDFVITGVPFGALSGGSSFTYLQAGLKTKSVGPMIGIITISVIAGSSASWGNYQLHEASFHAPPGRRYCDLFVRLEGGGKKILATWFSAGVIVGHFAEGFLDTLALVRACNGGPWVQLGIGAPVGVVIAGVEGNTELLNTLWHLLPDKVKNRMAAEDGIDSSTTSLSMFSKFLLAMASTMHGLSPAVGVIEFTQLILKTHHQ